MAAVGMILLLILKIIGWILLAILVLLAAVLLVPACVWLRYEKDVFSVSVGLLGIRIQVWPQREKHLSERQQHIRQAKEKAKEEKAAAKAKKKQENGKKKEPGARAKLTLETVCALAGSAGIFLRAVFGALRIRHIRIRWPVHAEDAAATALRYGKAQAWLHTCLALLNRVFWLDFDECRLEPDFTGKQAGTEYFSCKISAQLIIIVIAAVKLVLRLKEEDLLSLF